MIHHYDESAGSLVTDDAVLAELADVAMTERTADDAATTHDGQASMYADLTEMDGAYYVTTGNNYGQRVTFRFGTREHADAYFDAVTCDYPMQEA